MRGRIQQEGLQCPQRLGFVVLFTTTRNSSPVEGGIGGLIKQCITQQQSNFCIQVLLLLKAQHEHLSSSTWMHTVINLKDTRISDSRHHQHDVRHSEQTQDQQEC